LKKIKHFAIMIKLKKIKKYLEKIKQFAIVIKVKKQLKNI